MSMFGYIPAVSATTDKYQAIEEFAQSFVKAQLLTTKNERVRIEMTKN